MADTYDQVINEARRRGWCVVHSRRGGHLRLTHPGGGLVFASATPGSGRAVANLRADIRRAERRDEEC